MVIMSILTVTGHAKTLHTFLETISPFSTSKPP